MIEETAAPPTPDPALAAARARRVWLRALAVLALVALGWAAWYFVDKRPRRELARQRAANARTITDLRLDLVWIAPGEFMMGSPAQHLLVRWFYEAREKLTKKPNPGNGTYDNERPVTRVTLTKPFWLGRTEVTQAQWTAVMGSNPSNFEGEDLPVEQVSWNDAMEFCRKLTERERAAGRLPAGYTYTLPTEAQWEYACRAGTTGNYAGDLDVMAWYQKNSGNMTHAVGTKQTNAWGLADMHGNVWEWGRDGYGSNSNRVVTDPTRVPSGAYRVYRGGSWDEVAAGGRSAFRRSYGPGYRGYNVGFRLALAPSP